MRGLEAIQALRERTHDLRCQDLAGFKKWLTVRLASWERDPVFQQRARIRDLRQHHPPLLQLEKRLRDALKCEREPPRQLQHELGKARHAEAGLSAALPRYPYLEGRLAWFRERIRRLEQELQAVRGPILGLESQIAELKRELGLDQEEARLAELLRKPQRQGQRFEAEALTITRRELEADTILTGVTLGAADTEFDQVLLRAGKVVAIVEVKRNPNDLARGWQKRHESLAWLKGELEDPDRFRTASHPTGRFEGYGDFDRDSFANVRDLYLISRLGPLWGADGRALARMAFRLSTDERCRPDEGLRQWCLGLTHAWETPDLLDLYAGDPGLAVKLLLSDDLLQKPSQD